MVLTALGPSAAPAGTGITIKPEDGSVIFARTLEFAVDLKSNILVVPRGRQSIGTAPADNPGLRWQTKYAVVGANAFDLPVTVDGLNEKGLHVGLFYFPGFATYQEVKAQDASKALPPWELGSFLLGTCSDLKEALAAAKSVLVGAAVQQDMGFVAERVSHGSSWLAGSLPIVIPDVDALNQYPLTFDAMIDLTPGVIFWH